MHCSHNCPQALPLAEQQKRKAAARQQLQQQQQQQSPDPPPSASRASATATTTSGIDVRTESWYLRYLQSNSDMINSIANMNKYKKNNGQIKMIGIEGDVEHGVRTRQEWTALQATRCQLQVGSCKAHVRTRQEWTACA